MNDYERKLENIGYNKKIRFHSSKFQESNLEKKIYNQASIAVLSDDIREVHSTTEGSIMYPFYEYESLYNKSVRDYLRDDMFYSSVAKVLSIPSLFSNALGRSVGNLSSLKLELPDLYSLVKDTEFISNQINDSKKELALIESITHNYPISSSLCKNSGYFGGTILLVPVIIGSFIQGFKNQINQNINEKKYQK